MWENLVQASDASVFELVEATGLLVIPKLPESDSDVRSHRGGQWMVVLGAEDKKTSFRTVNNPVSPQYRTSHRLISL